MALKSKKVIQTHTIRPAGGTWHVNIDADVLCYRVAWACQKTKYRLKSGKEVIREDSTRAKVLGSEYKQWDDSQLSEAGLKVQKKVTTDELDAVKYSVNHMIQEVINSCNAGSWTLYLTGSGNYRAEIATRRKYKAGRSERPVLYKFIRDYMVDELGALMIEGMEADDALSIASWDELRRIRKSEGCSPEEACRKSKVILASIDKDLKQVPGWFYNISWMGEYPPMLVLPFGHLYWIDGPKGGKADFSGLMGLYFQMLIGDTVDAIPGCDGVGPSKAYNILKDCTTEGELYEAVLDTYREKMGDVVSYIHWTDLVDPDIPITKCESTPWAKPVEVTVEEYLQEQANLLFMLRKRPVGGEVKLWKAPK